MNNNPAPVTTSDATLFRKKPVVIKATQWHKHGDHPAVIRAWHTAEGDTLDRKLAAAFGPRFSSEFPAISTLEGLMRVTPGDWIITGVKGEHYPCKPDVFAASYEPASAPTAALPIDFKQATDQGGWQWVPKTPTPAMLDAVTGDEVEAPEFLSLIRDQYAEDYCAMLAAAPTLQGVADGDAVGGKSGEKL